MGFSHVLWSHCAHLLVFSAVLNDTARVSADMSYSFFLDANQVLMVNFKINLPKAGPTLLSNLGFELSFCIRNVFDY